MKNWLDEYFGIYQELAFNNDIYHKLIGFKELAEVIKGKSKKMMFAGNGASASISSHCSIDFLKQANVKAVNFNEANLITCFANDYGYENWIKEAINYYADRGDAIILISSSGSSPNVVKAADFAKSIDLQVVTFTGFDKNNPLKQRGDLNFWVDSKAYNIVECIHMMWITTVIDLVIGKAIYPSSVNVAKKAP